MATLKNIADHIIDICENAVRSKSKLCELYIDEDESSFFFKVSDKGIGMDEQEVKSALDPFYTTKTERKKKFGMGLPFLKYSSELTGGNFKITSEKGYGTVVEVLFKKDSIDCQPVGDIAQAIFSVIYIDQDIDWYIKRTKNNEAYEINSSEMKKEYGEAFFSPVFMKSIKDLITSLENEF